MVTRSTLVAYLCGTIRDRCGILENILETVVENVLAGKYD